jgi:hypothetical protein
MTKSTQHHLPHYHLMVRTAPEASPFSLVTTFNTPFWILCYLENYSVGMGFRVAGCLIYQWSAAGKKAGGGGGGGGDASLAKERPPPHRRKEDSEKVGGIAPVEGRCLTTQVRIPSFWQFFPH